MRYKITKTNNIKDSESDKEYKDNESLCDELNRLNDELQQTRKVYRKCLLDKQKMKNDYVRLQVKMELKG